jgi:hypothetical protein
VAHARGGGGGVRRSCGCRWQGRVVADSTAVSCAGTTARLRAAHTPARVHPGCCAAGAGVALLRQPAPRRAARQQAVRCQRPARAGLVGCAGATAAAAAVPDA